MAQKRKATSKRGMAADEIDGLLAPIISFMASSGLSVSDIHSSVERLHDRISRRESSVSVGKFERIDTYREVVSRWTTDPAYLDEHGFPRMLSLRGTYGFGALLRSVDESAKVGEAIQDLRRYGNIRRRSDGKLMLLKSFLHVSSGTSMAFEPHFQFLSHASRTTSSLLNNGKNVDRKTNFWRVAEVVDLPEVHLEEFLKFSKVRSLAFLKELDEWLRAHSQLGKSSKRKHRAGMGLFSYFEKNPR